MKQSSLHLVLLLFVTLVFGSPASAYESSSFVAPEGKAMIVFIQNRRADRKMKFTVFGTDRRCVAEVGGREAQILPTPPGPYILYIVGYESTTRVELYIEAGRTYFVRLFTQDRSVASAPQVALVRRTTDEHRQLKYHLDGANVTSALQNTECYGMPLEERSNRTQRRINAANAGWKAANDVTRDQFTLIERDGLTPEDISRL